MAIYDAPASPVSSAFPRPRWIIGQQGRRSQIKLITGLVICIVSLVFLAWPSTHTYVRGVYNKASDDNIPNQVHFVYALSDPNGDFKFKFSQYLSMYGCWYYWKPHTIFLHTNANKTAVARARDGVVGKWGQRMLSIPGVKVNYMEMPSSSANGVALGGMEHKSDFMRVKAVHDFGGVYIDFDVQPLRDIAVLRRSGFNAIGGRQLGGELNSGTFMSKKGSKMIVMWMQTMNKVYNGGWTTHSNGALTAVGQRLVQQPGEMLIMEPEAFAPLGWTPDKNAELFGIHNETSNLENVGPGDHLLSFEEELTDRWDRRTDFPEWARDWSMTYLLHGFSPARNGNPVEGFEHVTPYYALNRQSNYARAVYPVARDMFHQGLITLDDTWDGK
ncbi:hypothetical protein EsH8_IV_000207 [Colletotrichum jinshuiense]